MATCRQSPYGTYVGLGAGHIVLDGDPAPTKGAQPPLFGPKLDIIIMTSFATEVATPSVADERAYTDTLPRLIDKDVKVTEACLHICKSNRISRRSVIARVNEGSRSFTCHPHAYPQVE